MVIREQDPHLRSTNEVIGYFNQANAGEFGHVEDLMVDEVSWNIKHMIADTRNWWPGKKVLVSPDQIQMITWNEKQVQVNLSREAIKNQPEYDPMPIRAEEVESQYSFD